MNASPMRDDSGLHNHDHENDIDQDDTMLKAVLNQLKLFIKSIIPSDLIKDLSPFISYPTTFLIIGAVITTWAFFVYLGVTKQNLPFLTTETSGLICKTVERDNTGTYLLDSDGYWQGAANFTLAKTVYRLVVSNIMLTNDDYVRYMQQVRANLQILKAKLLLSDLNGAIVAWIGFSWTSNRGNNRIELVGDTRVVYASDHVATTLASSKGVCNAFTTTFDINAAYKASINYDVYMSNPLCYDALQLEPSLLGYNNVTDGENIRLSFDLTGVIIANAISISMIGANELEYVPGLGGCHYFNKSYYRGQVCWREGYHPKFPGMDLLSVYRFYAFLPGGMSVPLDAAALRVGSYWGLSVTAHAGNGKNPPERCPCDGTPHLYPDPSHPCNRFSNINALLMSKNWTSAVDIINIVLLWTFGEAVEAGVFGARWGSFETTLYRILYYSSVYGGSAIENNASLANELFGKTGCRGCVVLTFVKMETVQHTWSVSPYYTQLKNGACSGANVLISDDAWARVFSTPFANLTEGYSVCHYPFEFFIFLVLGSSFGNAASVFPATLALAIVILTICKYMGVIPDFYSKEERVTISDDLSIALLKLRDGHINPDDPLYSNLSRISRELLVMASSAERHERVLRRASSIVASTETSCFERVSKKFKSPFARKEATRVHIANQKSIRSGSAKKSGKLENADKVHPDYY